MFSNFVGRVRQVPESIRSLPDLKRFLKDGTVPRWAVVEMRSNKITHVWAYNSPEDAAEGAFRGAYIVTLKRIEKDTKDLLEMCFKAIERKEALHVSW